jgi:hypothetical protein
VVVVETIRQVLQVVLAVVVVVLLAVEQELHHQFKATQVGLHSMGTVQVAVVVRVLETTQAKMVA